MCFSAEASFGASAMLTIVGLATVKKVKTRAHFVFAVIPLIFAFQQFSEGFVWLSSINPSYIGMKKMAVYSFLFAAQVIWPMWIPISIYLLEPDPKRKKYLFVLLTLGSILAAYHIFCLLVFDFHSEIRNYHVYYELYFPRIGKVFDGTIYLIPVIIPPFLSSHRGMKILGSFIFSSFLVSVLFYEDHVISVWCFFAAIISVVVYSVIVKSEKDSGILIEIK